MKVNGDFAVNPTGTNDYQQTQTSANSGITLSPIHGKVISDLIVDGRTGYDIADYDPVRFDPA